MSLLSIVASSSAFCLPASPPPKGSSIDSDWSTKNKKQPGFLRLISAWYGMVFLHLFWHQENYDSHMPEVTGWSLVATCLIAPTGRTRRDPDHLQLASFGAVLGTAPAGGPDASPTVLAALFRFPRWARLGPGPALSPRHACLHHRIRSPAGETVRDGTGAGGAPSRH